LFGDPVEYGVGFLFALEIKFDPEDLPVPCRGGRIGAVLRAEDVETNWFCFEQIADQEVKWEEFRVACCTEGEAKEASSGITIRRGLKKAVRFVVN
jgi:hypothetical protein